MRVYQKQNWKKKSLELKLLLISQNKRSELTALLNKKFNKHYKADNIKALCLRHGWKTGRDGRYQSGHKTWNKNTKGLTSANVTSFKQGHKPHNYKPVGTKRITVDGYQQIKVSDTGYPPTDWVQTHRVLWQQHYGVIPDGSRMVFIDGDKTNITIDNLALLTNAELARINQLKLSETPAELRPAVISLARVIQTKSSLQRKLSGEDK